MTTNNNNFSASETSIEEEHPPVSVTDTPEGLHNAIELLAAGHGPLAFDAERANGFRFSQRPYLIQVYRRGAGVVLLDPPALGDLSVFTEQFSDLPWILHAASQDLPNLREHGMEPKELFDTELSARILGIERFGLAALLSQFLDINLAKKFSAVDWSTRPLPEEWLIYAALDVEYLIDLYDLLFADLVTANRLEIAQAEFDALLTKKPKPAPAEPWRKLSGTHQLKSPHQLEIARQLWTARYNFAEETGTAPGRLIPDRSITAVSLANPQSFPEFMQLKEFTGRASRSEARRWWAAIKAANKTSDKNKPTVRVQSKELPPVRAWERNFPIAKLRYDRMRLEIQELSAKLNLPHDLLLSPETLRNITFDPPIDITEAGIGQRLKTYNTRDWQISYIAPIMSQVFVDIQQS